MRYSQRLLNCQILIAVLFLFMAATGPCRADLPAAPLRLLCLRLDFADVPGEPVSQGQAEAVLNGLAQFVRDNSSGRADLEFTVTPVLRLPQSRHWYMERGWTQALCAAGAVSARNAGFDPAAYSTVLVVARGEGTNGEAARSPSHYVVFSSGFDAERVFSRLPALLSVPAALGLGMPIPVPFDPASGGFSTEAGDFSKGQVNSRYKLALGWLTDSNIQRVQDFGTFALNPFDVETGDRFTPVGLEIPRDERYAFWVEARRGLRNRPWMSRSVLIHRTYYRPEVGADLVDTTPGSEGGLWDAGLLPGRTFADRIANIFITVLDDDTRPFGDWRPSAPETGKPALARVMVRMGKFEKNHAPEVSLGEAEVRARTGAPVKLHANGTDADGDALAYAWDFGDRTYAGSGPDVEKVWVTEGQYSVRCAVTDMKGGVQTAVVQIAVSNAGETAAYYRLGGRLLDGTNSPAAGIEVSAGGRSPVATGPDGSYLITGLAAGTYTVSAWRSDWEYKPVNFVNPVKLDHDLTGLDMAGRPLTPAYGTRGSKSLQEIYDSDAHLPMSTCMVGNALYVFIRGKDRAIWYRSLTDGKWSSWRSCGGDMTSPPTAVSWGPGRIDLFARSGPQRLMHISRTDGKWSAWEAFEFYGQPQDAPGVCSWESGRLDLFLRGQDNAVWHRYWAGYWSGWESLGGKITAAPVAACWEPGRIDVIANSVPGKVDHLFYWKRWSAWESLPAPPDLLPELSMTAWAPGRLDIFGRGIDGTVRHYWYDKVWRGWESLGGVTVTTPSSFSTGPLKLNLLSVTFDGDLRQKVYDEVWKDWETVN